MSLLRLIDLGGVAYGPALEMQNRLVQEVLSAEGERACLLLAEHDPPVITLGRRGRAEDMLVSREKLAELGIEIHETSRGGEVTYHGPGQLVGYPILQLARHGRDIRSYIRNLEEVLIRTLGRFGLDGRRRREDLKKFTGVWVAPTSSSPKNLEKIASIGVAVRRWVSYHGFALNVRTDLEHFGLIVPCGLRDARITSMSKLIGRDISVEEVKPALVEAFREVFGFDEIERAG